MNAQQLRDRADDIAENAFLKLIGRIGMATAFPVLVAGMTWLGSTLWAMNGEQAALKGQVAESVSALRGEIGILRATIELQMADRYRGIDAKRDFELRDQKNTEQDRRIDTNSRDIRDNSARIRALEGQRTPQ